MDNNCNRMKKKKENSPELSSHHMVETELLQNQNGYKLLVDKHSGIPWDKQAVENMQERENSYFGLFNSVTDAIYIHREDGTFLSVNNGAIKMYGYSREELIGQNPQFVSAPGKNNLAQIDKIIKRVAKTGNTEQFEFWGRRKNGEIFPKEVVCNVGKYLGENIIITTARDISERKQAEKVLKDNNEKYRMLIELAADAFFQGDAQGNLITVNSKAIDITGYSRMSSENKSFIFIFRRSFLE